MLYLKNLFKFVMEMRINLKHIFRNRKSIREPFFCNIWVVQLSFQMFSMAIENRMCGMAHISWNCISDICCFLLFPFTFAINWTRIGKELNLKFNGSYFLRVCNIQSIFIWKSKNIESQTNWMRIIFASTCRKWTGKMMNYELLQYYLSFDSGLEQIIWYLVSIDIT